MQALALAAKDQNTVAGQVELIVVRGAVFVEANDPYVLLFQLFKGADEVDDAGDADVFGCSRAGFDGDRAQGGGAALGQDDAVNSRAVCHAEQRAEVLRVFNTVESEEKAGCSGFCRRWIGCEKVLDGEELLRVDQRDNALMGGGLGDEGQLFARLLADVNASHAAEIYDLFQACIVSFLGHHNVVKAASAGLECFFYRVQAIQNIHEG
jgi:hypothetical protein